MPLQSHDHDHDHDQDHGLQRDLALLSSSIDRRRALGWLAGAGAGGLAACGTVTSGKPTSTSACSVIPDETAGPFPADGSNTSNGGTSNALMLSGIVRSDIRAGIAGATGVAQGVPLTLTLQLVNFSAACADLSSHAIYVWHCDRDGSYSLYSPGVTNENYLRGLQAADSTGRVTFTTVFPGCYAGRMPHIHFEVYRSVAAATSSAQALKTSQLALPVDVCSAVYASATGYAASVAHLARITFATDNVFSDGVSTQLASVAGSVAAGYTATLHIGVAA